MFLSSSFIYKSDIDFFTEHYEQLKFKEEMGTYTPRFCVAISCTPTAHLRHVRIEFRGAVHDLVFDVPLNPPPLPQATPISPSASSIGNSIRHWHMHSVHNSLPQAMDPLPTQWSVKVLD